MIVLYRLWKFSSTYYVNHERNASGLDFWLGKILYDDIFPSGFHRGMRHKNAVLGIQNVWEWVDADLIVMKFLWVFVIAREIPQCICYDWHRKLTQSATIDADIVANEKVVADSMQTRCRNRWRQFSNILNFQYCILMPGVPGYHRIPLWIPLDSTWIPLRFHSGWEKASCVRTSWLGSKRDSIYRYDLSPKRGLNCDTIRTVLLPHPHIITSIRTMATFQIIICDGISSTFCSYNCGQNSLHAFCFMSVESRVVFTLKTQGTKLHIQKNSMMFGCVKYFY